MSGTTWSKFYWNDWLSDPALRRSSFGARGLWFDLLCIAAQHDPIGYVAVNNEALSANDIARMVGGSESEVSTLIGELERNGVLSRNRKGIIYSRRLVRDDKKARTARENGKIWGALSVRKRMGNSALGKGTPNPQKPYTKSQEPEAERKKDAASAAPELALVPNRPRSTIGDRERELFERGKEVLGQNAGGLIKNLLASKGAVELARAAIETAATKQDPREYIGAMVRGRDPPTDQLWDRGL